MRNQVLRSICLGTLAVSLSQATVVPNGATVALNGTTLAASPFLAGTVIADTFRPFSITSGSKTYTGEVEDQVIRETSSGNLDFCYRMIFDQQFVIPVTPGIFQLERSSFEGWTVDTDSRLDEIGNLFPTSVCNSQGNLIYTYPWGNPKIVNSHYSIGPALPNATRFTYVRTTAKSYNSKGNFQLLSYGYSPVSLYQFTIPAYQPSK